MEKLTRVYDREGNVYDLTPDLSDYVTNIALASYVSDYVSRVGHTGKFIHLTQAADEEIILDCNC